MNEVLTTFNGDERDQLMENAIQDQPSTEESDFFKKCMEYLESELASLFKRNGNTLLISLRGTIIGLLIGLLVGVLRTIPKSKSTVKNVFLEAINWLMNAYIAIFRRTPMCFKQRLIIMGLQFYGIGT